MEQRIWPAVCCCCRTWAPSPPQIPSWYLQPQQKQGLRQQISKCAIHQRECGGQRGPWGLAQVNKRRFLGLGVQVQVPVTNENDKRKNVTKMKGIIKTYKNMHYKENILGRCSGLEPRGQVVSQSLDHSFWVRPPHRVVWGAADRTVNTKRRKN